MSMNKLLSPLQVGAFSLPNRMLMAPLTRTRADAGHLPNALMAEYYAQRASAGLIITECTMVQPDISAFGGDPGIYSDAQMQAWKETTAAVHAKGGRIFPADLARRTCGPSGSEWRQGAGVVQRHLHRG
jgi:N-ethylmaleimide reductase